MYSSLSALLPTSPGKRKVPVAYGTTNGAFKPKRYQRNLCRPALNNHVTFSFNARAFKFKFARFICARRSSPNTTTTDVVQLLDTLTPAYASPRQVPLQLRIHRRFFPLSTLFVQQERSFLDVDGWLEGDGWRFQRNGPHVRSVTSYCNLLNSTRRFGRCY